jgi:hypothetical protein
LSQVAEAEAAEQLMKEPEDGFKHVLVVQVDTKVGTEQVTVTTPTVQALSLVEMVVELAVNLTAKYSAALAAQVRLLQLMVKALLVIMLAVPGVHMHTACL